VVVCDSATESDAWATAFLVEPELEEPAGMRVLR
jgi:thiamine biosynthesis lipoprotein ApbE